MLKTSKFFVVLFIIVFVTACNNSSTEVTEPSPIAEDSIGSGLPEWTLGIQTYSFHVYPFFTALKKTDSAGIKFIEAYPGQVLRSGSKTLFDITLNAADRKAVKQAMDSMGIAFSAFGVVTPKTPKEWRQTFEFAKDMNIPMITASPLKNHWDTVNALAGEYNIKVAIHEEKKGSPYWHPDSVLAAINNRPNLGVCADIGHWGRSGLDAVSNLKLFNGRIMGLHLKDIVELGTDSRDTILGMGKSNIAGVLAELKRQNFKGVIAMEYEAQENDNLKEVIQNKKYFDSEIKQLK
jgi:sugar phosphate isomerase/epimerase